MHQHGKTSDEASRGLIGNKYVVYVASALALASALAFGTTQTSRNARPSRLPIAAPPPPAAFDPSRFILNALLVPALDADAVPLRWVDPRPALHCGPDTAVRVNHEPLLAGALVPDTPFELEWQTDGCRPFGAQGPRFDGRVRLTVFREDWGFSALVEPAGLRVALAANESRLIRRGSASLPQFVEDEELVELN